MKKRLSVLSLFLVAVILFAQLMVSCSGSEQNNVSVEDNDNLQLSDDAVEDTDVSDQIEAYEFPDVDYGGTDFIILNINPIWDFITEIIVEEQTGEALNDAMYTRNTMVGEQFGVNLKEIKVDLGQIDRRISTAILAGDDTYDIMYCPTSSGSSFAVGSLALDGLFYNLLDIPELKLDKTWWDKTMLEEGVVGSDKALYFAASDIHFFWMQAPICMFFNEDMMQTLGLDLPYSAVRKGEWTLDEFNKYTKAGARLNGDESFAFNADGNSIYGYATWQEGITSMIIGTGEKYVTTDNNGMPYLAIENERFYNVCQKIADMLTVPGEFQQSNNAANHHEGLFKAGRALFMTAELKGADVLRTMDTTFGIAPMPKYDTKQESYHTMVARESLVMVIPVTNSDPHKAGIIMDAMAYLSHKDVTPVFYDITVSQKRLRNEESVEMLKIIRDSKYFNIGLAYGWINGSEMYGQLSASVFSGNGNIVSIIEKYRDIINGRIADSISIMSSK